MFVDGATVMCESASELRATLEYGFSQEKDFNPGRTSETADSMDLGTVQLDASKRSIMYSVKLVSLCSLIMEKLKLLYRVLVISIYREYQFRP